MTKYKFKIMVENLIFAGLIILWLLPVCIFTLDMSAYILMNKFIIIDWSILRTFFMVSWTICVLIMYNTAKE